MRPNPCLVEINLNAIAPHARHASGADHRPGTIRNLPSGDPIGLEVVVIDRTFPRG
jgi:hypothetical protein